MVEGSDQGFVARLTDVAATDRAIRRPSGLWPGQNHRKLHLTTFQSDGFRGRPGHSPDRIRINRERTNNDVTVETNVITIIVLVPFAYLLGTFPSAVLIARSRGIDITTSGSGNPGASNVGRLLGRKLGVLVFVLDGLKGAVAVAVGYTIDGHAGALALACAAVVGHVFPITRGFKGGKGVATAGGSVIALYPVIGAAMTALWLITAKLTKKASLGSLAIAVGFPIAQAVSGRPWGEIVTGAALCAFVIWRHLPNLKRQVQGDELSLKKNP